MLLRKHAINIGLKSVSFSKFSRNLVNNQKNNLIKNSSHLFSSSSKDKYPNEDEFNDSFWDKMSEVERRQFSITEGFPEKYPKKIDQIYFYRGLSDEIHDMPGAAIVSFLKAIDYSSNDKLKSEAYEKIACMCEKMNLRDKAEDIRKKKLNPIKDPKNNFLKLYQAHNEISHLVAV